VRTGSKKEEKDLKTCRLFRKASVKLGLRKAWFLRRLAPFERS
jgi:hypothetical protein